MPNCITHCIHARTVLKSLPADLQSGLHKNAYDWAAQGPDFLFCHRYLPWMQGKTIRDYGSKLHVAKPSSVFEAMRGYLREHNNPIYRGYVLGFLNHYTMDSIGHPYVYAMMEKLTPLREKENRTTLHAEVESALDTILLRRNTGKLPSEINLSSFFPKDMAVQLAIAKLYRHVLKEVFQADIEESEILRATKDARFVYGMLNDKSTLKQKLFTRIERNRPNYVTSHFLPITESDDFDYANITGQKWRNNRKEETQDDFFSVFDQAVNRSVDLIECFMDGDLSVLTGEVTFSGKFFEEL